MRWTENPCEDLFEPACTSSVFEELFYPISWILCMNGVFISINEEEDGVYPSSECDGDVAFCAVLLMKFRISVKYESSLSSKMALPLSSSERGDDIAVPTHENNIY